LEKWGNTCIWRL